MDKIKITIIFLFLVRILNSDFLLVIPRINLYKSFNVNDKLADSLEINISKAKIIFGHSGYGTNSYFNNLVYLSLGDKIIFKENTLCIYEIIFVKNIIKGSKIVLENHQDYLYLITCDINNLKTRQVVIGTKLVKKYKI